MKHPFCKHKKIQVEFNCSASASVIGVHPISLIPRYAICKSCGTSLVIKVICKLKKVGVFMYPT